MRYRTIIEIITDAENENDAIDLAGEFLRGNIEDGVEMKFHVRPLKRDFLLPISIILVLVFLIAGVMALKYFIPPSTFPCGTKNVNTIQPPLKTDKVNSFKEEWQDKENKKVLDYIKNK